MRVGDRVRIAEGPLRGIEGLLVSIKNECRLVIAISLLQRMVSAEIERDWVRKL